MSHTIQINGSGYTPLKDYNSWRIAGLFYQEGINDLSSIQTMGRHMTTDEVFVLLRGNAWMATAGSDEEPAKAIQINLLKQGEMFVVEEKEWHVAILEESAEVLIIENKDTSDSSVVAIDNKDIKAVLDAFKKEWF